MTESISLRKRLIFYVITVMLIITAASGLLIYKNTLEEADEIFDASLVQTARLLDGLITRESIALHGKSLEQALQHSGKAHEYERKLFFVVLDRDGKALLESRGAPASSDLKSRSGFFELEADSGTWFCYSRTSSHQDLIYVVGEHSGIREEITEYIGSGLILPLLLLLPPLLWLLWVLVGFALKPLQQVTRQILQQHLNSLQPIDVDAIPIEIKAMLDALNHMISDLDAAYAREHRFVSDASHELRNPLASLLINVENALEENQDDDIEESLNSMRTSIQRLSNLVSQLLQLSRNDNPAQQHDFASCDLVEICRSVLLELEPETQRRDQRLEFHPAQPQCNFDGVENLIYSLVRNLAENAMRHSGRETLIRVYSDCKNGSAQLRIEDSGKGLSAEQMSRAMDRFYRAGDTNAPGSGLGLAIVKSIAKIHGGEVRLESSGLGGLSVSVHLWHSTQSDP